MRLFLITLVAVATLLATTTHRAGAQGMPLPSGTSVPVPQFQPRNAQPATTPPSLQSSPSGQSNRNFASGQVTAGGELPRTAGQEHRVFDLRPYTGYLTK